MGVTVGVVVIVVVLAGGTAAGLVRRRRDGRLRAPGARREFSLTQGDLRLPLGARATLLQFSSPFCAPCRAARQLLADVAARADGVRHVEVDVASRLDLVERLDVTRTPTVFVLGPRGQIRARTAGVPRRDELDDAIANAYLTDRK